MNEAIPSNAESPAQQLEASIKKLKQPILNGDFELYNGGKAEGSFKPNDPQFPERIERVRKALGLKYIFAPSLNFTKRTASVTDQKESGYVVGPNAEKLKYADEGVLRTEKKADGGIIFFDELEKLGVKPEEIALAGFNADCPFIIGYEEKKRAFFMLHAGLGCLHQTGERKRETIFSQLIKDHKLDPKRIKIHVTAGIQKCCYGRSDKQVFGDVLKTWGVQFGAEATSGSRVGQQSVNMAALIFNSLLKDGVKSENVDVDAHCTCCDGKHWSNVKGDQERNLVLVRPTLSGK